LHLLKRLGADLEDDQDDQNEEDEESNENNQPTSNGNSEFLKSKGTVILNQKEERVLKEKGEIIVWKRVTIGNDTYTSRMYSSNKKTQNSIVEFKYSHSLHYGEIIFFVQKSGRNFALISCYEIFSQPILLQELRNKIIQVCPLT
jgi:hypothetical protein